MSRLRPAWPRLVTLIACCAMVAGPARASEAPAADFWFPWQGALIGAAVGGVGGYFLVKGTCGGGGIVSCDASAAIGAFGMATLGALAGGVIQGLFFWPQSSSAPARPLGAMPVSLLPSISAGGTTSLELTVRF